MERKTWSNKETRSIGRINKKQIDLLLNSGLLELWMWHKKISVGAVKKETQKGRKRKAMLFLLLASCRAKTKQQISMKLSVAELHKISPVISFHFFWPPLISMDIFLMDIHIDIGWQVPKKVDAWYLCYMNITIYT